MTLIIITSIAECGILKNTDNLPKTNNLEVLDTESKVHLELENDPQLTKEESEAKKSLQEIINKLTKELNSLKQQTEDISIRNSKEQHVFILALYNTFVEMLGNFAKTISDSDTVVLLTLICFKPHFLDLGVTSDTLRVC